MLAFVVVAVACAVLVVNAARSSAVDLLRGPLPALAATKVWHLVPGVEHAERPAEPAPLVVAAPVARPASSSTAAGDGQVERTPEAAPATQERTHHRNPDRTRGRDARLGQAKAAERSRRHEHDRTEERGARHRHQGRHTRDRDDRAAARGHERSTSWARSDHRGRDVRGRDHSDRHDRAHRDRGHQGHVRQDRGHQDRGHQDRGRDARAARAGDGRR